MRGPIAAVLLVAAVLAGCLGGDGQEETTFPYYDPADGLYHFQADVADGRLHFDYAPGAVGKSRNDGDVPLTVTLPPTFLLLERADGGTMALPEAFTLQPGQMQWHLAPPAARNVTLDVDGETVMFDPAGLQASTTAAVSGEAMVEAMRQQEAEFPHREPGQPNYARAIAHFAQVFEDLGYTTEADPYGTVGVGGGAACVPALGTLCPESLANVVAWKPGTESPETVIFVAGGHFDVVPGTTHGAFDNTAGTVGTLELARALAPYEFRHTIMFGLWGGEENGLLGSNFWVQSNPDMRTRVLSYWNLDVIGMTTVAPVPQPDPILIAAGPDVPNGPGPVADEMLEWARTLQTEWIGIPDSLGATPGVIYEGVAGGQLEGYAGVNAQSDHTSFIAAGIPSYFIFNGDALAGDNPVAIHSERDTLTNMTKYSLYAGEFDLDAPWPSEDDRLAGEAALAASFESTLWFPFYHALLVDLGVHTPPTAG